MITRTFNIRKFIDEECEHKNKDKIKWHFSKMEVFKINILNLMLLYKFDVTKFI